MIRITLAAFALSTIILTPLASAQAGNDQPLTDRVEHHYADSNGVKIHYVTIGEGPLIVMIHGFPDFWYTWRDQMEALSAEYTVAAIDLRGYNRSDKPKGVDQYAMPLLIGDVAAVIRDQGQERAIICGHDWGGAIAWSFAMYRPDMTERLMICNLPHPNGLGRELASNPDQQRNSAYARRFQQEGAHENLTAEGLAGWVTDDEASAKYIEAFERSDFEAMLNYYKANYPRVPGTPDAGGQANAAGFAPANAPRVSCSVLMIHGLNDQALLASGLNDTWEWIDADLTIVTIPGAGHFVQQDASDLVTRTMQSWLSR